jgi:two-component system sensor histidine kinase SenX3
LATDSNLSRSAGAELDRLLVRHSRDLIALYDLEDRSLRLSPALETQLGVQAARLDGAALEEFVHPDDLARVVGTVAHALRRGESIVARARVRDRNDRWLELEGLAVPVADELGAPATLLVIARDVSDRRWTLEALAESERSYRLLIEEASDAITIADATGRLLLANPGACALLGYERRELLRLGLADLVPAEGELDGLALERLLAGRSELAELSLLRRDGEPVRVEISASILADGRVLMIVRDLAQRDRREGAEREFVVNAAHDLRTPLAGITAALEILESGAKELPEDRDRFLEDIGRETGRLSRLVRGLLVLALVQTYQEALQLEPVRLGPLLQDVARSVPGGSAEVVVDCPPDLAALSDPDLLERVVTNLMTNAVASTEAGTISLGARPLPDGAVEIEVADTGLGIATGEQERVFDRFYRAVERDGEGFGLGLSIVRETVRALRGSLDLESTPGVGTTVRVSLPGAEGLE